MWFFRRKGYEDSSRTLVPTPVDKLNPSTDLTLEKALKPVSEPEKTRKKFFGDNETGERNMKMALATYSHMNVWGQIANENHQTACVVAAGHDEFRGWFVEMPDYGELNDFDKIRENPDSAQEITAKNLETLATLHAVGLRHLEHKKDLKKQGMFKAHRSITKYGQARTGEGSKTDVKTLRRATNAIEPLLGDNPDFDACLQNFLGGRKIDEDKTLAKANGLFDVAHLIEQTSFLDAGQVAELKQHYVAGYNKAVGNINAYVAECRADTKGTILRLIDTYLDDSALVQKIKKKIERKAPKTFEQYKNLLQKKALKNNIYLIDSHLDNMFERRELSEEDFEVMYQSSKVLRCLSSYANHSKRLEKSEKDSKDFIYYSAAKKDQLEKAIDAVGKLEEITKELDPAVYKHVLKMKEVLEKDYAQTYKDEELDMSPMPIEDYLPIMPLTAEDMPIARPIQADYFLTKDLVA